MERGKINRKGGKQRETEREREARRRKEREDETVIGRRDGRHMFT